MTIISYKTTPAMPRILIAVCITTVLMPPMALAQSNARLVDSGANESAFTPAVTYPVNESSVNNTPQNTVQAATPATDAYAGQPTSNQASEPAARHAVTPATSTSEPSKLVGDTTNELLTMQMQGKHAGASLPTLGATAGPAWKRYVDSFSHPLPEWFQEKLEDDSN